MTTKVLILSESLHPRHSYYNNDAEEQFTYSIRVTSV